ncbi:hypothetical protein JAAARDRAFT_27828 [Jaapia argillacea MUCL 33604]|uniref:Uncharacterized protein n=1 Tax=Jaapia argillacea MUCL 33604 TaxID=933084 RepID=A0A067QNI4_9AGAM|nr:hypothetical protein JAAARDRAFT_27828 [Jaapia argillacea MUCL 33604]
MSRHHNPFSETSPPDYSVVGAPLTSPWSRPPSRQSNQRSSHSHRDSVNSGVSDYSSWSPTRRDSKQVSIVHVYRLTAGSTQLQFLINVDPGSTSDEFIISLSMKAGCVERKICEPTTLKLAIDPRKLEFCVFLFPPKTSLPAGCLYALRVWLRANGVDHRLFSEDDLWIGDDPDFNSIADASFARLHKLNPDSQVYRGRVGKAELNFIARWTTTGGNSYKLTLDYKAGGVGRTLFEDLELQLDCDPQEVLFVIYTVPMTSIPPGATHRVRLWLRCPVAASRTSTHAQAYVYQRIWKSDELKVGSELDFSLLGRNVIMAVSEYHGTRPRASLSASSVSAYSDTAPLLKR